MVIAKLLELTEIQSKLKALKGWALNPEGKSIQKDFKFENFTDAVCFLNQVAEIAEEENHHPDLHLTNYKNLKVVLSTHSDGGVTKKDFILAAKIEEVFL